MSSYLSIIRHLAWQSKTFPVKCLHHYSITRPAHFNIAGPTLQHCTYLLDITMSDSESPKPVSVLFVCLGNICQYPSPTISTHLHTTISTPSTHSNPQQPTATNSNQQQTEDHSYTLPY
jgi:hypothetical protein